MAKQNIQAILLQSSIQILFVIFGKHNLFVTLKYVLSLFSNKSHNLKNDIFTF